MERAFEPAALSAIFIGPEKIRSWKARPAKARLRCDDGRIDNLPLLEKLAELAQKKSFEHLALN